MPAEKFYPPTAVECEPSDHLAISWYHEQPGTVTATMHVGLKWSAMDLDRSALNRMIRALRKARDQTFGADE